MKGRLPNEVANQDPATTSSQRSHVRDEDDASDGEEGEGPRTPEMNTEEELNQSDDEDEDNVSETLTLKNSFFFKLFC